MTEITSKRVRQVFRFFDRRRRPWSFQNSGFAINCPVRTGRRVLWVNYKIHANAVARHRVAYRASITIWPGRTARRWNVTFSRQWCAAAARSLAHAGYHGTFRVVGRRYYFGDFWKRLADPPALVREARRLEAWALDREWMPHLELVVTPRQARPRGARRRRTRGIWTPPVK